MRLLGLDPTNDMAEPRAIVMHGAPYVGENVLAMQGKLGRSQGCFAVAPHMLPQVLAMLGQGRMLYSGRCSQRLEGTVTLAHHWISEPYGVEHMARNTTPRGGTRRTSTTTKKPAVKRAPKAAASETGGTDGEATAAAPVKATRKSAAGKDRTRPRQ